MTPIEIEQKIRDINTVLLALSRRGNELDQEKSDLRNEYKRLTGMDI